MGTKAELESIIASLTAQLAEKTEAIEDKDAVINGLYVIIDALNAKSQPKVRANASNSSKAPSSSTRDYGPRSTRKMTEEDAIAIMTGELKDKSVNECCTILGLSRGQIYSCRGQYTFTHIKP